MTINTNSQSGDKVQIIFTRRLVFGGLRILFRIMASAKRALPRRGLIQLSLSIAVLAVLGAGSWEFVHLRVADPLYRGKLLNVWLEGYFDCYGRDTSPQLAQDADLAVRQIGTNALPLLISMVSTRDSPLKAELIKITYSQPWINSPFTDAGVFQARAVMGFRALGAVGEPAVAALTRPLNDWRTSAAAATSLSYIGEKSIPFLAGALTNADARVRDDALRGLQGFKARAHEIIPFMLDHLRDRDPQVRSRAAEGLGAFAKEAATVVPRLLQVLLEDQDDRPRRRAAESLGNFRDEARQAVPALLLTLKDKDQELHQRAATSLWLIDEQAAVRAGVVNVFKSDSGMLTIPSF